jgi:hypothetical protein
MGVGSTSSTQPRVPKGLLLLLGIPLLCCGLCVCLYWFVELRPQYVEISPLQHPCLRWDGYTERSVLEWRYSDRYYLWRQAATWQRNCGGWNDVIGLFDEKLTHEGWTRATLLVDSPCSIVVPETQMLERVVNGYVVYMPSDTIGYDPPTVVCLAVWLSSGDDDTFAIALGTRNKSPLTQFSWD